ncbi:MAG: aromatic amino acid transport family protein [Patescibacteria group bacterium]|jgi:tyrosine-specific transport protein
MSPYFIENGILLFGGIVGAGIFALPFALKQGGVLVFSLGLIVISVLMFAVNRMYRHVIDTVDERHQLIGYVTHILGKPTGMLVLFLDLFSLFGALLAYLIIGGEFLSKITLSSSENMSFLFYGVAAILLLFAGKLLRGLDILFTILKGVLLVCITGIGVYLLFTNGVPKIDLIGSNPLAAYGAILFACTGFSIVPELFKDRQMSRSLLLGQGSVAFLYGAFAIALAGLVSGETFNGLNGLAMVIFNLAGVSTVFAPYLILSWVVYDIFNKDLGIAKRDSLILVVSVPLLLFLLGFHSFSAVISLSGGVFIGGIVIIITRMYMKAFPGKHVLWNYLIQAVFVVGILIEFYQFFLR